MEFSGLGAPAAGLEPADKAVNSRLLYQLSYAGRSSRYYRGGYLLSDSMGAVNLAA